MELSDFSKLLKGQRYIIHETVKHYIPNTYEYNIEEYIVIGNFINTIPINYPHILLKNVNKKPFNINEQNYKEMKKYIVYTPLTMIKKIETLEEFIDDLNITLKLPSVIWDYICNFI
jgi:hypothetical protein